MVEAILAPSHADALEALLDELLAGVLDEAASQGQLGGFEGGEVEVLAVGGEVVANAIEHITSVLVAAGLSGFSVEFCDDLVDLALAETAATFLEPGFDARAVGEPCFARLPELAGGMVEVEVSVQRGSQPERRWTDDARPWSQASMPIGPRG